MRKFVKERTDEIETLPSIKSQKINSNSIATALHIQTIVDPNENSLIIPISGSYNFNFNLDKNSFFQLSMKFKIYMMLKNSFQIQLNFNLHKKK